MIKYTVKNFTGTIKELSEHFNIPANRIKQRLKRGLSIEEAVNPNKIPSGKKRKIYTINGYSGTFSELAEYFGINENTVKSRMQIGMSIEEAFSKDIKLGRKGKIYSVNGFTGTIKEISEKFNIPISTINNKLRNGISIEDIVNNRKKN